ncbi:FAD-binding oxidoreductase [Chloroflexota bacterium]
MKGKYGKVTEQIIKELTTIIGRDSISTKEHELEGYSCDEMPLAKPHAPQVIVRPADTTSVAKLLTFANEKRIPLTPRGAGTGLSGGCIPIYGGILLSLERMNRILKVDGDNFVAVVEPGVTLSDLFNKVEQLGLYYPIYPGEMTATIGGTVATNAGGMNAVKYGVTRHHILGLEAVLPNGEIIKTGGEFVKCTTGYDLTQLLIGSEGTLAVVTKVILKLTTKPAKREVLFVPFTDLQNAIDAVPEILRLKMTPIGIEFIERSIIEITEKYLERDIPYHQYEAFLMIIMDGESEDEIYEYFARVEEICKQHDAIEVMVPGSERAKRRLLEAREGFYHALKRYAPMEIIDTVVPCSEIARFVKRVKEISEGHKIPVIVYGHAGDGNVHLHPICVDMDKEEWERRLPQLMSDIYQAGISFNGAISGEHGIGINKKAYLPIGVDKALLNTMKGIKRAFDPNNILNPGKIFDLCR